MFFLPALRLTLALSGFAVQIENLQEQLRDKEKQMSSLKERVKSLQADTSNTDTALTTLEESLAEKVSLCARFTDIPCWAGCRGRTCNLCDSVTPLRSALSNV